MKISKTASNLMAVDTGKWGEKEMAIRDKDGRAVSFDSDALIAEAEADIAEFGENFPVFAWLRDVNGAEIIVNYDFSAIEAEEFVKGEFFRKMLLRDVLAHLRKQDSIL